MEDINKEIPYGYCHCGCGQKTRLIHQSDKSMGWIKGEPRKYLLGHVIRKNGPEHHNWNGGKVKQREYILLLKPNHPKARKSGYILEHIYLAEKALGKSLPEKAVIHHHSLEQIVICQDQAYHMLLHQRARALMACGHSSWRKCHICKQYDDPENLTRLSEGPRHKRCHADYMRNRRS